MEGPEHCRQTSIGIGAAAAAQFISTRGGLIMGLDERTKSFISIDAAIASNCQA
jgi:hypothetical protein